MVISGLALLALLGAPTETHTPSADGEATLVIVGSNNKGKPVLGTAMRRRLRRDLRQNGVNTRPFTAYKRAARLNGVRDVWDLTAVTRAADGVPVSHVLFIAGGRDRTPNARHGARTYHVVVTLVDAKDGRRLLETRYDLKGIALDIAFSRAMLSDVLRALHGGGATKPPPEGAHDPDTARDAAHGSTDTDNSRLLAADTAGAAQSPQAPGVRPAAVGGGGPSHAHPAASVEDSNQAADQSAPTLDRAQASGPEASAVGAQPQQEDSAATASSPDPHGATSTCLRRCQHAHLALGVVAVWRTASVRGGGHDSKVTGQPVERGAHLEADVYPFASSASRGSPYAGIGVHGELEQRRAMTEVDQPFSHVTVRSNAWNGNAGLSYRLFLGGAMLAPALTLKAGIAHSTFPVPGGSFPSVAYRAAYVGTTARLSLTEHVAVAGGLRLMPLIMARDTVLGHRRAKGTIAPFGLRLHLAVSAARGPVVFTLGGRLQRYSASFEGDVKVNDMNLGGFATAGLAL